MSSYIVETEHKYWEKITIKYSTKAILKKKDFGNLVFKYDVIYDALEVICNKNLKHFRNVGDIGFIGDLYTKLILAKNREIAWLIFGDTGTFSLWIFGIIIDKGLIEALFFSTIHFRTFSS